MMYDKNTLENCPDCRQIKCTCPKGIGMKNIQPFITTDLREKNGKDFLKFLDAEEQRIKTNLQNGIADTTRMVRVEWLRAFIEEKFEEYNRELVQKLWTAKSYFPDNGDERNKGRHLMADEMIKLIQQ